MGISILSQSSLLRQPGQPVGMGTLNIKIVITTRSALPVTPGPWPSPDRFSAIVDCAPWLIHRTSRFFRPHIQINTLSNPAVHRPMMRLAYPLSGIGVAGASQVKTGLT